MKLAYSDELCNFSPASRAIAQGAGLLFCLHKGTYIVANKLKRAVIKEELVALTCNYVDAILLNQFIYWSERVDDFDDFIREEIARAAEQDEHAHLELRDGWIYKKAEELAEETMLGLSKSNMMNHIKALITNGWIDQRRNPRNKMDKTYQYRVNIVKVQRDLFALGYGLEGYRIPVDVLQQAQSSETQLRSSKTELRSSKIELPSHATEPRVAATELGRSEIEQQYQRLQTETTPEITLNNNTPTVAEFGLEITLQEVTATTESDITDDADIEFIRTIETHLHTPIFTLYPIMAQWIQQYGRDSLLKKAHMVGQKKGLRNIIGAYRAAVANNWTEVQNTDEIPKPERDERYIAFYELFPDEE